MLQAKRKANVRCFSVAEKQKLAVLKPNYDVYCADCGDFTSSINDAIYKSTSLSIDVLCCELHYIELDKFNSSVKLYTTHYNDNNGSYYICKIKTTL